MSQRFGSFLICRGALYWDRRRPACRHGEGYLVRKYFHRNVAGETPAVPVKSLRDCRLLLLARIRYQANWAKQSGRECLDLVHVLRLESFSVTKVEQTIIRETVAGHVVHR